tara:strand:- start:319 stop:513 length:195 start_codon:yes stop_codon:yes gene_type:complete
MLKKIENEIVSETVDTLLDKVYEELEYYMYESGNYDESDDEFMKDYEAMELEVVKELYNRIKNK